MAKGLLFRLSKDAVGMIEAVVFWTGYVEVLLQFMKVLHLKREKTFIKESCSEDPERDLGDRKMNRENIFCLLLLSLAMVILVWVVYDVCSSGNIKCF